MIPTLEESAAMAWPALAAENRLGWQCRSAAGYTQRANSCLPLHSPGENHEARIVSVESYYAALGQPAVFKLPEQTQWEALDQALADRGYSVATPSRVMTKPVEGGGISPAFYSTEVFDQAWWAGYLAASGLAQNFVPVAQALAARVNLPVVGRVTFQGRDAAWGFASLVGNRAWVFDVVVDPAHRRQGLGRLLMTGLEAEVARRGISSLNLQVLMDNPAANTLYEGLGFAEAYHYHYRRQK